MARNVVEFNLEQCNSIDYFRRAEMCEVADRAWRLVFVGKIVGRGKFR